MRLIDADELWQNYRPEYRNENQVGHREENKAWNDCIKAWHDIIEETPSCDTKLYNEGYQAGLKEGLSKAGQDVKHGYWKNGNKCTVCETTFINGKVSNYNYCPICGARMDKKPPEVKIKDFEMPESCDECFAFDDNGDYPTCGITNLSKGYNWNPRGGRMDSCPLAEVEE